MSTRNSEQPENTDVRYEADEKPPPALAFGLGLQLAVLCVAGGWDAAMAHRLDAAGEETLLTLLRQDETGGERERRRLLVVAHKEDDGAVLEFVAASGEENLQDRIALLGEQTAAAPLEREVSLRLLRHLASSVHHQQYHDTDIVTLRVETPAAASGGGN